MVECRSASVVDMLVEGQMFIELDTEVAYTLSSGAKINDLRKATDFKLDTHVCRDSPDMTA